MEQRVSLITLGVADLHRSREFYEKRASQTQSESPHLTSPINSCIEPSAVGGNCQTIRTGRGTD